MLWGVRPVVARAAYGIAVDHLRRQIHSGLLLPQEKLPAERQLSDDFGISRVTLREALRVLETDRYISVKRGARGGAFVADAGNLIELSRRRITREPAYAMRVLEYLQVTEVAAASFAALRVGLPEKKRMRYALELMKSATALPYLKQAETYFHLALADASHNSLLVRGVEAAHAELFLPYAGSAFAPAQSNMIAKHETLFTMIDDGQTEPAKAAMNAIFDDMWALIRTLIRSAA